MRGQRSHGGRLKGLGFLGVDEEEEVVVVAAAMGGGGEGSGGVSGVKNRMEELGSGNLVGPGGLGGREFLVIYS